MIDLYPHVRATLKAHAYFATTLGGFEDSQGNFKCFKEGEAPTDETPFIEVEINPGEEHQNTSWSSPFVTFHVWGADTDWGALYALQTQIRDVFRGQGVFASVGGAGPVEYVRIGPSVHGEGRDPVTERVSVSVALRLGIVDQ